MFAQSFERSDAVSSLSALLSDSSLGDAQAAPLAVLRTLLVSAGSRDGVEDGDAEMEDESAAAHSDRDDHH